MDGYPHRRHHPRRFAEMADLDYGKPACSSRPYAAQNDNWAHRRASTAYAVPLMDLFLFAYDKGTGGLLPWKGDAKEDMDDLHRQLMDGQAQMLGKHYTAWSLLLEEGGDLPVPADHHREAEKFLRCRPDLSGEQLTSD